MRPGVIGSFLLALSVTAGGAFAQNQYYLSQVANGDSGGYRFRTSFILFNNTDTDTAVDLKLTSDSGAPFSVTLIGVGTGSEFSISLIAGATRFLQTDGSGALATGAATVDSPVSIGVSAIFTIYDSNGNYVTEAGVGSSNPLTDFVLPVDSRDSFSTGVALFNIGNGSATVTMELRDFNGVPSGQTSLDLGSNIHVARFVTGPEQLFPALSTFQGTMRVHSTVPIAALVLRQNAVPLSYTSLPVVSTSSTQNSQNLAQVANGSFAGGSFKTSFLLFNLTAAPVTATVSLTNDAGLPLTVTIPGKGTASSFNVPMSGFGSAFLQTDGSGDQTAGAATINSASPVGASAIFTVFDAQGRFQTEAGVGNSLLLTASTLPVDLTGNFDTGVAFFNPGSQTSVTLKLLDPTGTLVGNPVVLPLGSKNHTAQFISQIFSGTANFRGSLTVAAPSGVALLTLRQNSSPLSYTTLPVVSGFSSGRAFAPALLPQAQTGISASGSLVINQALSFGFRLTGQVSGAGMAQAIVAKRSDGVLYTGALDGETGRYLVVVDRGTYSLQVSFQPNGVAGGGTDSVTYSDTTPIQVSGDTTRDIQVPSIQLYAVSGTVSGLGTLPDRTGATVVFTSQDNTIQGQFTILDDGSYQGSLPNANYQAAITVPMIAFTPLQNESLALYNLASGNINGAPATVNLSIPGTAKVSGTVRASWLGAIALGIRVSATDKLYSPGTNTPFISAPATSSASADASGAYQMILSRGRSYLMGMSVPVLDGSRRLGTASFPFPPDVLNLDGDASYNLSLPALPEKATVTGRVTDSLGRALSGVSVTAYAQGLSGAPNLGFAANTITDSQGNYSLTLLSGTGYRLDFIPPIPTP